MHIEIIILKQKSWKYGFKKYSTAEDLELIYDVVFFAKVGYISI